MMLPRAGGRDVGDVRRIIGEIFARNLAAWEQDEATFTGKKIKRAKAKPARAARKPTGTKRKVPKRPARKR